MRKPSQSLGQQRAIRNFLKKVLPLQRQCLYPCLLLAMVSVLFLTHFSTKNSSMKDRTDLIQTADSQPKKSYTGSPVKTKKKRLMMEWQRAYHRNGLGNQLFLHAAMTGLAARHGFQPVVPSYSPIAALFRPTSQIAASEEYDQLVANGTDIPHHETHSTFCCTYFPYTEHLSSAGGDVVLRGSFQSWKYFHPDFMDRIKTEFTFRDEVVAEAQDVLMKLLAELGDQVREPETFRLGREFEQADSQRRD